MAASAVVVIAFALGCGAESPAPGRVAPSSATVGAATSNPGPHAAIDPPPPPSDLPGAAARPPEPEIPADTTALSARYTPRPLAIPRTAPGRSARFTFDQQRRGWFARMPEASRENPLTPVYARGRVMVGGGFTSHTFYAFDARTGELDWRASAPDGGPTAAIVEDGKVLFNTESCTLFVVDVETGRQRWSRWLGDPLMSQPAAANGRVFSGHVRDGGGYGFTAMSLASGRILWTRNVPADVLNAPVLDGTDVYFTTMNGTVWRLDQASGRVVWRRNMDATSAPWLHGDTVHVSRRERRNGGEARVIEVATVLSTSDGTTVREHDGAPASFLPARPDTGGVQAGWEFEGSRPTIVDGRAYQTIGNEVQARDAETGELLWKRQYTEPSRGRPASSPAIAGSQMVFGTRDGVLYGLDIDTGMTAWAYDVGEPIVAQPTVAHGWVYASTTRGGVVALEVGDDSLDGWHMWGGNASHSGPVIGDVATPEEDDRPSEGTLRLEGRARSGELAGFPLQGTTVSARVTGFVARVTVEQEFTNPYQRPVEATYLFPLPESAAVDAMEMRIGSRVVRADIRRRREAREAYDDARRRGVLTSLLEQERPNLFRQSIANVRPGDTVRVVLSYTQALPYEEGSYRLTYPMVAGPRYEPRREAEPGTPAGEAPVAQTVLASGARSDRVELSIDADLGIAVAAIESPTHAIDVTRNGNSAARVVLHDAAAPDRDLEVRFQVAGAAPAVSAMTSAPAEGEDGHLALSIHPRIDVANDEITARELVFVVDTSSSMHGRPMELARAAMIEALHGLREGDTFRVLGFSDSVRALSDAPLPATPENVARGEQFVRGMQALGATEMLAGIESALEGESDPARMRIVLLMTDGYIGNESEVFRAVHERLGDARVFAFGVGSAVNRYLLTRVAEEGRGDVQVVMPAEDPARAARVWSERIARPYLTDVSIDWGGLAVHDAYPRRLPDLYADRPLRVHARYGTAGDGEIVIRGRIAGRAYEQRVRVSLPAGGAEMREELASIWARTRIGDLTTASELVPTDALTEEITQLGLRHHLLTPYTAFVAIDEGYHVEGERIAVEQPSALPHGMTAQRRTTPDPAAPTRVMRGATVSIAPSIGGAGGSALGSLSPRPAAPRFDEPMDAEMGRVGAATAAPSLGQAQPDRRMRRPIEPTPTSGPDRCYALARRPDGTIDEDALQRCLAALRGGPGKGIEKRALAHPELRGDALEPAAARSLGPGRDRGRRRDRGRGGIREHHDADAITRLG